MRMRVSACACAHMCVHECAYAPTKVSNTLGIECCHLCLQLCHLLRDLGQTSQLMPILCVCVRAMGVRACACALTCACMCVRVCVCACVRLPVCVGVCMRSNVRVCVCMFVRACVRVRVSCRQGVRYAKQATRRHTTTPTPPPRPHATILVSN